MVAATVATATAVVVAAAMVVAAAAAVPATMSATSKVDLLVVVVGGGGGDGGGGRMREPRKGKRALAALLRAALVGEREKERPYIRDSASVRTATWTRPYRALSGPDSTLNWVNPVERDPSVH